MYQIRKGDIKWEQEYAWNNSLVGRPFAEVRQPQGDGTHLLVELEKLGDGPVVRAARIVQLYRNEDIEPETIRLVPPAEVHIV